MAVEIITKGQLPSERLYMKTCTNCRTLFRFKASDTEPDKSGDPRDAHLRHIVCPLPGCKTMLPVGESDRVMPVDRRIEPRWPQPSI
jgi:hypothetical protein